MIQNPKYSPINTNNLCKKHCLIRRSTVWLSTAAAGCTDVAVVVVVVADDVSVVDGADMEVGVCAVEVLVGL